MMNFDGHPNFAGLPRQGVRSAGFALYGGSERFTIQAESADIGLIRKDAGTEFEVAIPGYGHDQHFRHGRDGRHFREFRSSQRDMRRPADQTFPRKS